MKKIVSHLLLSLGITIPAATVTSCCNLSNNQNNISQVYSTNKSSIKKIKFNENEARVIHCKGLGENHFADIFFYYANGKQTLKINTYQNMPHVYFRDDDPYVTLKISTQNDEKKFELKIIGDKVLTTGEEIVALEEGYKIDFYHREGYALAEFCEAECLDGRFKDKNRIGCSSNLSFFVSSNIDSWQKCDLGINDQYNTIFSDFGFFPAQKKFNIALFDKITDKKIATLFVSTLNGGCIYLLSDKNASGKEKKLSFQDKSGTKYNFSFKQNEHYVIGDLIKNKVDFNFSNIDDFVLKGNQLDKAKYLLEISNHEWFYLTADDIWNVKNRDEYVLTEQDHVLMQYSFKKIVSENRYLRANLLSHKYKCFYQWILNSKEALYYYLTVGHAQPRRIVPMDSYNFWIEMDNNSDAEWKAFEIWYDIWRNHPESSCGKYLMLAIAIAMELANGVSGFVSCENVSPLKRYELFVWLDSQGVYKARPLENNSIQGLRNIVGFKTGNEDLRWLYLYVSKILEKKQDYWLATNGYSLARYAIYSIYGDVFGNQTDLVGNYFYGAENTSFYRLIKYGGVCGSAGVISGIVGNLFGVQAMAIGQPGHCAYIFHNDASHGFSLGYKIKEWDETGGYDTWLQWMFADDQMHYSNRYFYDEFYAIGNYIDGSLYKNEQEQETDQKKVTNNFHELMKKNNRQICINEKSQWGWVRRSQILDHFSNYAFLEKEIDDLKTKSIERVKNVFQNFEKNRDTILSYFL